jgi:hypothetical protein
MCISFLRRPRRKGLERPFFRRAMPEEIFIRQTLPLSFASLRRGEMDRQKTWVLFLQWTLIKNLLPRYSKQHKRSTQLHSPMTKASGETRHGSP